MAGVTREVKAAADPFLDRVGLGLLTHSFPPALVDEVIDQAGVREQRRRALPARLMVYFTLALWLYVRCGYGLVMDKLTVGLRWRGLSDEDFTAPRTESITKARQRLGPEVMRLLFDRTAGPIGAADTPGVWWRGRRVCSLDGTTLAVPDSPDNQAASAQPGNRHDTTSYPLARVVALAENGAKAVIDAAIDGYQVDERGIAARVIPAMRTDMLVLGDRGFPGHDLWAQAAATGAALVWRLPAASFTLPVRQVLPDGSYLSRLRGPYRNGTRSPDILVRVIEYAVHHPRGDPPGQRRPGHRRGQRIVRADHHPARPGHRARGRTRRVVPCPVGSRNRPGRTENHPARRARRGAALPRSRWRAPGILGHALRLQRSARGDLPRRRHRRGRSGPDQFTRALEAARDSAQRDFTP